MNKARRNATFWLPRNRSDAKTVAGNLWPPGLWSGRGASVLTITPYKVVVGTLA